MSDTPGPQDENFALVFSHERVIFGTATEWINGRRYERGTFYLNKAPVEK